MVAPILLFNIRIQMIMPSFSALLTDSTYTNIAFTWKIFRNSGPFLGSVLLDKFDEIDIFFGGP
jgi:hypothetical protein